MVRIGAVQRVQFLFEKLYRSNNLSSSNRLFDNSNVDNNEVYLTNRSKWGRTSFEHEIMVMAKFGPHMERRRTQYATGR